MVFPSGLRPSATAVVGRRVVSLRLGQQRYYKLLERGFTVSQGPNRFPGVRRLKTIPQSSVLDWFKKRGSSANVDPATQTAPGPTDYGGTRTDISKTVRESGTSSSQNLSDVQFPSSGTPTDREERSKKHAAFPSTHVHGETEGEMDGAERGNNPQDKQITVEGMPQTETGPQPPASADADAREGKSSYPPYMYPMDPDEQPKGPPEPPQKRSSGHHGKHPK
ncbi:hypothetical protein BESB_063360 [Besnoitia besnoiti]|uniref:Uncharacterized protein n=1 Tax=Besnoitia besnoiti TaxID=94643 RepID=A0A2A9MC57_BESBE|nr:hypothetical protein BESB_063360 [Besnoitia besnoiti]PFH35449.1 hypothetical protein BESB_063360 [Besnoitia besnoiti]